MYVDVAVSVEAPDPRNVVSRAREQLVACLVPVDGTDSHVVAVLIVISILDVRHSLEIELREIVRVPQVPQVSDIAVTLGGQQSQLRVELRCVVLLTHLFDVDTGLAVVLERLDLLLLVQHEHVTIV